MCSDKLHVNRMTRAMQPFCSLDSIVLSLLDLLTDSISPKWVIRASRSHHGNGLLILWLGIGCGERRAYHGGIVEDRRTQARGNIAV